MKKLRIPYIDMEVSDINRVAAKLLTMPVNRIDTVNWPEKYPSKPEALFRIAHNGDNILLQYQVHEGEILGMVNDDNGKVWTDSCVEFFIALREDFYYNLEVTCVGRALLGHRRTGTKAEHAATEVLKSIKRLPSLGYANREKEEGDFRWTLTLVIPRTAYWKDSIETFSGLKARANFYKCGDNLTIPHFVSWSAIGTPDPSFHQPDFFGELIFE